MTEHHYSDGSYDIDWADDGREALAEDALTEEIARLIQQFEGDPEEWRNFRDAANAILDAGFRRQGPITEAQVEAAIRRYWWTNPEYVENGNVREAMRAALEAARDAS